MCECNSKGGVGLVAGIVLGAAIGAGAALMLAPDEGGQTRKKVIAKAKRVARETSKVLQEFKDEKVDPVVSDIRAKMDEAEDVAEGKINKARNKASNKLRVKAKPSK